MKYIIIFLSSMLYFSACRKEKEPQPPDPNPIDTPYVYVPIYLPGDTSMGAGYAKKLNANWSAEAKCRVQSYFDTNYVSIVFLTYSAHGEQRESLGFDFVPRFGGTATYELKKTLPNSQGPSFVSPYYNTWRSDGDVSEDQYALDTTARDNNFGISQIDHFNLRIECSFTATFKILEPRRNPANPKTVKFSQGKAWAIIREE